MSSSSCIVYPKPFETLDKRTLPNDIGFTMTEIAALRNGWRLINRRFAYHSKRIFMEYVSWFIYYAACVPHFNSDSLVFRFFQEHETLLERFRDRQGKFDMAHLHGHPEKILSIYGRLIEKGVDDVTYMNVMMAELSLRHRRYGVSYDDIKVRLVLDIIRKCQINMGKPKFIIGCLILYSK